MPDTNITIDAQGNVTRGTPGKMTELNIEHAGGHVTGRTDHTRPPKEKPATKRGAGRSKSMSLDQIIGRTGAGKTGEVVEKLAQGPTAEVTATPAPPEPASASAPEPVSKPAPAPEHPPEVTPPVQEEQTNDMWTADAQAAQKEGRQVISLEHQGMTLYFTQQDIATARNTAPENREELEQVIVDYGDKMEPKPKPEKRSKTPKQESPKKPESAPQGGPAVPVQEETPKEEPQPEPEVKPEPAPDAPSRKLDLGSSSAQPEKTPESIQASHPAAAPTTVPAAAPSMSNPLRRVSVQELCDGLGVEVYNLYSALQYSSFGAGIGIHPDLFLHYAAPVAGGRVYLIGYGSNITHVQARNGSLYDSNSDFGIDEVCAWANGITWVVRRTDI